MKFIRDLNSKERSKILKVLEDEGYTHIKDHESYIKFSKGLRNFELVSTDIYNDDEDLGVRVDFDFDEFMKDRYIEKTRHSKSFQEALNQNESSLEEACKYLEWKIIKTKEINGADSGWKSGPHADSLIEVLIGPHTHIIVNDTVFMGELAPLWEMGTYSSENAFEGSSLEEVLVDIGRS